MAHPAAPSRYYFGLDELRAGLMLIGVFWHAVSVIAPNGNFVYASKIHQSPLIFGLIYPEHIFRMEAFFLVSGFLSAMVLSKKSKREFMNARFKRVLVPLVLGCFGVNILLQIAGAHYLPRFSWEYFDLWRLVMHGWFLITLFLCALIDWALPKDAVARRGASGIALIFIITAIAYVALSYWKFDFLKLAGLNFRKAETGIFAWNMIISLPENLFNFLILNTVQFWPFYAAGAWLYSRRAALDRLPVKWVYWALALGLTAGLAEYLHSQNIVKIFHGPYQLGALWYRLNHIAAAGGIGLALFLAFYRSPRKGGKSVRYLINSAIVIYLVHHPFVILLGKFWDTPALSNIGYYALLTGSVLAASYAAYEFIRRSKALRFAFGLQAKT